MKNTFLRVFILIVVFLGVCGGALFFTLGEDEDTGNYRDRGTASLPLVSFQYEGISMNTLVGYVGVDAKSTFVSRDVILPLGEDRQVSLVVTERDKTVQEIRYQVYDMSLERLYEENRIQSFTRSGKEVSVTFSLTSLLEKEETCQLHIYLVLDSGEEVFYSTRAIYREEHCLKDSLTLSQELSDAFLEGDTVYLQKYVSFTGEEEATDLSHVTLKSGIRQATWANLDPVLYGERQLRVYDITPTQVAFSWVYDVQSLENQREVMYDVEEYFSIRLRAGKYYVLAYERYTQEEFPESAQSMGATSILLGIQRREDVSMMKDSTGKLVAFTVDRTLQYYDYNNNEMIEVFAYDASGITGQQMHDLCDIKILNMDENGDLSFAVWGYRMSGEKEGSCGLSLYRYQKENNVTEEIVWVPFAGDYMGLQGQCGNVLYTNSQGLCYFDFGNTLYSVDKRSMECLVVATDVERDLCVSRDGSYAAWGRADDLTTIYILNMETNELKKLQRDGEPITAIGFIESDFVLGILADAEGNQGLPDQVTYMDTIEIVDQNLELQIAYAKENVLIREVKLENYSAVISRVQIAEAGVYETLTDDVLTLSEREQTSSTVALKVSSSNTKYNYYYINFGRSFLSSPLFGNTLCRYRVSEPKELSQQKASDRNTYQAYLAGRLVADTESMSEAIQSVYDGMGVVVKNDQVVWDRDSRSLYVTLRMPEVQMVLERMQGNTDHSLEAALITMQLFENAEDDRDIHQMLASGSTVNQVLEALYGEKLVHLTGCDPLQVLYYINERHPVLAVTGSGQAVLLYGYNSGNVHVYEPLTGTSFSLATDGEAQEYFEACGNIFFSYES